MSAMFNHSKPWTLFQPLLSSGVITPHAIAAEAAKANDDLENLAKAGVRVSWLTSADFSANLFGPCAIRYPLDVLTAGDLYKLGWHNAPLFLAAPAGWTGPASVLATLTPATRSDVEDEMTLHSRVDVAVTWPLAVGGRFAFNEPKGTAPEAEVNLRQWDYLALFVADCTVRHDGPKTIDNLHVQAARGAAALLRLLMGRNASKFDAARASYPSGMPVNPVVFDMALRAVVVLDWDAARNHAAAYGGLYDLAEATRLVFNAVTGTEVTLKALLSAAFD